VLTVVAGMMMQVVPNLASSRHGRTNVGADSRLGLDVGTSLSPDHRPRGRSTTSTARSEL